MQISYEELCYRFEEIRVLQRGHFRSGATRSISYRKAMLKQLYDAIQSFEKKILKALYQDLHKSEFEAYSNEVGLVYAEIRHAIRNLRRWTKKRSLKVDLHLFPAKACACPEPYGTVLIMAPWNYPFQLLFSPLVGALSAGNTAVLKPSELAPATAEVMSQMVAEFFPPEVLTVVKGGVPEATALLDLNFDYIFFTGSVPVGKIVANAAAKRLIPHTLELGGKSPVFVDQTANLKVAAEKIVWGKFNNAGQTCVAPDYLLVHTSVKDRLIKEMKEAIHRFYGEDVQKSGDYGRIINERHFERLLNLIEKSKVVEGGTYDKKDRYIAPTILDKVEWEDKVMYDEIFGPILPILEYKDLKKAMEEVNHHPKPLALYVFSRDKKTQHDITRYISFGGGGINQTLLHVASVNLPFGGVGPSGSGQYHGKASFDTFSHYKTLLSQPSSLDPGLAYPHKKIPLKWLRKILH